jgi:hypothetical protein
VKYESHYTHHFFRLWGVKEGAKGIDPSSLLLGNAQNSFDALFGDVAAVVNQRFFLIEFKLDREGIVAEVGPDGKPHRGYLHDHLEKDHRCRLLSSLCHFASYPDTRNPMARNQLTFERYVDAARVPYKPPANPPKGKLFKSESHSDMGPMARFLPLRRTHFDNFHALLMDENRTPSQRHPGCYETGLGLPAPAFMEYIACMYQHLTEGENAKGQAVLGVIDPRSGVFIGFGGTVDELIKVLLETFLALHQQLAQEQADAEAGTARPKPAHGMHLDDPAFKVFGFPVPASPGPTGGNKTRRNPPFPVPRPPGFKRDD